MKSNLNHKGIGQEHHLFRADEAVSWGWHGWNAASSCCNNDEMHWKILLSLCPLGTCLPPFIITLIFSDSWRLQIKTCCFWQLGAKASARGQSCGAEHKHRNQKEHMEKEETPQTRSMLVVSGEGWGYDLVCDEVKLCALWRKNLRRNFKSSLCVCVWGGTNGTVSVDTWINSLLFVLSSLKLHRGEIDFLWW